MLLKKNLFLRVDELCSIRDRQKIMKKYKKIKQRVPNLKKKKNERKLKEHCKMNVTGKEQKRPKNDIENIIRRYLTSGLRHRR